MFRDYIQLFVNGKSVRVSGEYVFRPLSDFLRYHQGLTGTKVVCAEGDCGACTVMIKRPDSRERSFASINSCISSSFLLDGCQIVTVEGLSTNNSLSEVQNSMIRNFGGQCGFCTPGFVMSMVNMFEQKKGKVTTQNIKNYLTGNLCRCTGYTPIIQAAKDINPSKVPKLYRLYPANTKFDGLNQAILIKHGDKEVFAPTDIKSAVDYKTENPEARIFSGATDLGVQINKGRNSDKKMLSLHLIKELNTIREEKGWVKVGARVNLSTLGEFLQTKEPQFSNFLNIFASPQIKNLATLIGNIANGSPIADTTPYLMCCEAILTIVGPAGEREIALSDFYLGYKKFAIKSDEIISQIKFRLPQKGDKIGLYKVSQRRDLDISCVNSSFFIGLNRQKIESAKIAFGGMGPTTLRLTAIEEFLIGKEVNRPLVDQTKQKVAEQLTPLSDLRGSEKFRSDIAANLFEKFSMEHFSEFL